MYLTPSLIEALFSLALPSAQKLILFCLIHHSNTINLAYPSQKTIAHFTSLSVRTVQRGLRELEEKGFISVQKRRRKGQSNFTICYQVIFK